MEEPQNVITVTPAQPCGCYRPTDNDPHAICGRPARAGVVYANVILPICPECAAALHQTYGQTEQERTV